MDWLEHFSRFGLGLLALTTLTVLLNRWAGAGLGMFPYWALLRAAVQLGAISLLLRGVLTMPATVVAVLVVMLTTGSWTAARRLGRLWRGRRAAVAGVLAGSAVALLSVFALGLLDVQTRYVIALGGIVIGNAMNAATLAGRNFLRGTTARASEVEAWLALGARPIKAHEDVAREAVRECLLPNLDQTKSAGLVTLPGAFVGALFGGASPAAAAQFQLVVLAGIALAMTVTSIVVTQLAARSPYLPEATD